MGANAVVWTKARRVWLRSRANDTQGKVGGFFQHLVARLLGCKISPHGHPEWADLFSIDLQIRVESKARGDVNSLEIRTGQIREYEEEPPFPLEHSLYALGFYQSTRRFRKGDQRPRGFSPKTSQISLMRSIRTESELYSFLSEHIQSLHLLDLKVVKALESHLGTRPCLMVGRSEETAVRVSRTRLDELFGEDESFAKVLKTLKLSPSGWAKGVYPIHVGFNIGGQELRSKFTLVTVLRKGLHAAVAREIANRTLALV